MDNRHAPFCWQGIQEMRIIRQHYTGSQRSTAISIYQTFTEVANERRTRDSFEATRKLLAERAGVHVDTLDDYVKGLQAIGLLACKKRKSGNRHLPNAWTLIDPEGVAVSDRQGGGFTPLGGGMKPLGGGGMRPAPIEEEKNKEENPQEGEDFQHEAAATGEERASAAPTASNESPPASSGVLNGPGEIQTAHLSDQVIRRKMRAEKARDWQIEKVLRSENPTESYYVWKESRALPAQGEKRAPKKRTMWDELGL